MNVNFANGYQRIEPLVITLPDGESMECAMPSLADIKKISEYSTNSMSDVIKLVKFIVDKNKSGKKYTEKDIESWGIDVFYGISEAWVEWIGNMRKN